MFVSGECVLNNILLYTGQIETISCNGKFTVLSTKCARVNAKWRVYMTE